MTLVFYTKRRVPSWIHLHRDSWGHLQLFLQRRRPWLCRGQRQFAKVSAQDTLDLSPRCCPVCLDSMQTYRRCHRRRMTENNEANLGAIGHCGLHRLYKSSLAGFSEAIGRMDARRIGSRQGVRRTPPKKATIISLLRRLRGQDFSKVYVFPKRSIYRGPPG